MHDDEIPVGKAENLIGKHFGEWTVLYRAVNKRKHQTVWKCKCSCGNEAIIEGGRLKNGGSTKCKECAAKNRINDLTNQHFGRLTVINMADIRTKQGTIQWNCLCDCGNKCIVRSQSLISGSTKSCGCLRKETMLKNRKK